MFIDFETEDYDNLKNGQLKRMADFWQRRYLLKNAKRNGYNQVWCPVKERYYNENKMEASHFIDRSVMSTRYDKDNVWLISKQSNTWDAREQVERYKSLHHKEFEELLVKEIGEKNIKKLLAKSKSLTIFAKKDYIDKIKKFRDE